MSINALQYRVSTEDDYQRLRADVLIWHSRLFSQQKNPKMHSDTHHLRQIAAIRSRHLIRVWVCGHLG